MKIVFKFLIIGVLSSIFFVYGVFSYKNNLFPINFLKHIYSYSSDSKTNTDKFINLITSSYKASAAEVWFKNQSLDIHQLKKLSPTDVSKRLTKAVFDFCKSGPQDGNIIDLFSNCITSCGGYTYVLSGLLESLGLQTRTVRLYNIPQQGNHVALEVKIADKWRFLDPTFGVFFTDDGTPEGELISLRELSKIKQINSNNVFRVINRNNPYIFDEIGNMFSNEFDLSDPLMNGNGSLLVSSYQEAEKIDYLGARSLLPLQISLDLKKRKHVEFGTFEKLSLLELKSEWLRLTNETLNDNNPYNDISYNTSYLDNNLGEKVTILKIDGLKKDITYQVSLFFYTKDINAKIQISSLGKFVRNDFELIDKIQNGTSILKRTFSSPFNSTSFLIRNASQNGGIRLFGVAIDEFDKKVTPTQ